MFSARRAVPIFGRRGLSVALRTSICQLHSQIHRRSVLLWSARLESCFLKSCNRPPDSLVDFNVNIYALIMSSWLRCNRI